MLESLGIKLFSRERTPEQHVTWAVQTGLLEFLGSRETCTVDEVCAHTRLTECGADSLLGVLSALGLVRRKDGDSYSLTPVARDFFLTDSPYFVGDQLEPTRFKVPQAYLRQQRGWFTRWQLRFMSYRPLFRFGTRERLANQHARNLGACVAAVKTGSFEGVNCVVDVAGGSGVFAIPFALDNPGARVILAELPAAIPNVTAMLRQHRMEARVEVLAMNAVAFPWNLPECDGIFLGNFLHGFSDEACHRICAEGLRSLQPGGRIWVHEMVWNDNRDGPLITALWHAAMRGVGPGRQRTLRELSHILVESGFREIRTVQTSGAYSLVSGRKPY